MAAPARAQALNTSVELSAAGWEDAELPLSYEFFAVDPAAEPLAAAGEALAALVLAQRHLLLPLGPPSRAAQLATSLPAGAAARNHSLRLLVLVTDAMGGAAAATAAVTVDPPPALSSALLAEAAGGAADAALAAFQVRACARGAVIVRVH